MLTLANHTVNNLGQSNFIAHVGSKAKYGINVRRTNVHVHLQITFYCPDVIIKCGQKVANIENNGFGR